MGRKNERVRSGLYSERTIQPVLGARHPVTENDDVSFFFSDARVALEEVLPPVAEFRSGRIRRRNSFLLYDDPDRWGISILEQRLARIQAQRQRIRWTKSDVGRIRGDIQNELARLDLTGRTLEVTFENVVRLGDAEAKKARKLALVPNQETSVAEFFCSEHEIAFDGISGSMRRFCYPYSGDWVPHFTFGRIFKEVPHQNLNETVAAIRHLLPLTIEVKPLQFYTQQEISAERESAQQFEETAG